MKRRLAVLTLTLATFISARPVGALAAVQNVDVSATDNFSVSASANVTEQEMADLGFNVIVSFPVEIALSLNDYRVFTGTDKIFAYGILDSDKSLSVTVDNENAAYGTVRYRASHSSESSVTAEDNYRADVTASLTKTSFTAAETKENFLKQKNGEEMTSDSTLSVSIADLLPAEGKGIYYTNIPVKLEIK